MMARLLADPAENPQKRVALLVNSLGATPLEELLLVYRKAHAALGAAHIDVRKRYVGHYTTSMEMAGCSISLLYLDDELEALLDAPTGCPVLAAAGVKRPPRSLRSLPPEGAQSVPWGGPTELT
jgi:dihydroxyacetone kinase